MGSLQREKGKRGQREAEAALGDRDYKIAELQAGRRGEDLYGLDPEGRPVSIEVKNCANIHLDRFRGQARQQARDRKADWLLLVRISGHPGVFYAEGTRLAPTIWRPAHVDA